MFAVDQSLRGIRSQDFHVASQQTSPTDATETGPAASAPAAAGAAEGAIDLGVSSPEATTAPDAETSGDGHVESVTSDLWLEGTEFVLPEAGDWCYFRCACRSGVLVPDASGRR